MHQSSLFDQEGQKALYILLLRRVQWLGGGAPPKIDCHIVPCQGCLLTSIPLQHPSLGSPLCKLVQDRSAGRILEVIIGGLRVLVVSK